MDPMKLIREVNICTMESLSIRSPAAPPPVLSAARRPQIWFPPPRSCVKINFDASFIGGQSAVAAIARDDSGVVIDAVIGKGFDVSALHAETRAARLAIQLASVNSFPSFSIEGDSQLVIKFLNGLLPVPWELQNCFTDMQKLLASTQVWNAAHISREANNAAHMLAKAARSNSLQQIVFHKVAGLPFDVFQAASRLELLASLLGSGLVGSCLFLSY